MAAPFQPSLVGRPIAETIARSRDEMATGGIELEWYRSTVPEEPLQRSLCTNATKRIGRAGHPIASNRKPELPSPRPACLNREIHIWVEPSSQRVRRTTRVIVSPAREISSSRTKYGSAGALMAGRVTPLLKCAGGAAALGRSNVKRIVFSKGILGDFGAEADETTISL